MSKKILLLGGLGFIGRNLFYHLLRRGYDVTVVGKSVPSEVDKEISRRLVLGNILDKGFMEEVVGGYEVIFSLAGSSGASESIKDPYQDLDTNLKGHLNILEAVRKHNRGALLIFPSSRLVYGKPLNNPVDENHPLMPESIYAIHKLTTEQYYLLYKRLYEVNCIIFRISNPYGPYQEFGSKNYGILNQFVHKAISEKEIDIYGDGSQKRDFIHIDDISELFEKCISHKDMYGGIFNVGFGLGISLQDASKVIVKYLPETKIRFKPWPVIDKKIETGDYVSNIGLLKKTIGWEPGVNLDEGILETIKFYERREK